MKKSFLIIFVLYYSCFFCQKIDLKVSDSIVIHTKNNATLSLTLIFNKNKEPQTTILVNTIYPDKKNIDLVNNLVNNGYTGAILHTRGKYLSSDSIEPFEHEAEDVNEAIDWIIKQPWSNGKVAMIGGSYLGFSQWAATKKLHPALKTIIPEAAVGIGTMDFPMRNNVFMTYSLRWLSHITSGKMTDYKDFNDEKKWNSVYKTWYESGIAFRKLDSLSGRQNVIFQRWLDHPGYDQFWQQMIPYKKEFSAINIPVLTITGYYDWNQRGALYYFKQHYQYNKNAEHYLIIGPYDHYGAQGNISDRFRGYTIDPAAKININDILIQWLDYIFKGKQKPLFLKNKINYQVMGTNQWRNAYSMDTFEKEKLRFYLGNSEMSPSISDSGRPLELKVDLKDRTDADALLGLSYNIVDHFIYTKNNLLITSQPFDQPIEFTGNFSGLLKFSVNKKDVDLYVNLYEQMPDGKYFLLSTYLSRASYAGNNGKRKLLTPGRKTELPIQNAEFVSRKIDKGSRLVAMIGVVKSPFWEINYGTGGSVSDETMADAKEPLVIRLYNDSYIEIPVTQSKILN
ncbi:CocE/NonD family hydrolase [Chryseobacterium gossypii]|uniref:CocE/NonD family hydrolase n=1 Tax=Chryseobacterium gossypii TaxID=3231602 RepID=UPI003523303C